MGGYGLYPERYACQTDLYLVIRVKPVTDPPVFQHGTTEILAVKAIVGTQNNIAVRTR